MQLMVDRDRCTGIGICESIAPDTFEVDDDGQLTITQPADDSTRALMEEAVRSCPARALTLRE
jgi:ferredoxin